MPTLAECATAPAARDGRWWRGVDVAKLDASSNTDMLVAEMMGRTYVRVPRFSTDMRAAWQVMDMLCAPQSDRYTAQISRDRQTSRWACHVYCADDEQVWCFASAQADQAPLAICRAFVAAVQALMPGYTPRNYILRNYGALRNGECS